jgi:dGTPase
MTLIVNQKWQLRIEAENKLRRDDHRSPYQRDRARILHSAAFRRLQAKTQVHSVGQNDFYRTRLTHSLEVSQVGTGILAQLKMKFPQFVDLLPSSSLIEALCLAHDIGHPPFGHGGEIALNYMMRQHGGFEGNAQTFRIVTKLEPYTQEYGMNLARRTLLGLLKYPALISQTTAEQPRDDVKEFRHLNAKQWHPAKGIYDDDTITLNWVLSLSDNDRQLFQTLRTPKQATTHNKTRHKSLDCSIMELADDIAYGVHDLEDAIVMGLVTREQWQEVVASVMAECGEPWLEAHITEISQKLFGEHHQRKDAIGTLVNSLLTAITIEPSIQNGKDSFDEPLLQWNAVLSESMFNALQALKRLVSEFVVHTTEIQHIEYKGQQLLMTLFDAFVSDPERLLPQTQKALWRQQPEQTHRLIADYLSSLTDDHAQRLYRDLFLP